MGFNPYLRTEKFVESLGLDSIVTDTFLKQIHVETDDLNISKEELIFPVTSEDVKNLYINNAFEYFENLYLSLINEANIIPVLEEDPMQSLSSDAIKVLQSIPPNIKRKTYKYLTNTDPLSDIIKLNLDLPD